MKKIINIILVFLLILMTLSNFYLVFANPIQSLYSGDNISGVEGTTEIKNGINLAINVIQTIGIFVAIAFLIFLGMKYMVASPGEKADIKKHLIAYVVGAVVMFGAVGILEIIETFAENATRV